MKSCATPPVNWPIASIFWGLAQRGLDFHSVVDGGGNALLQGLIQPAQLRLGFAAGLVKPCFFERNRSLAGDAGNNELMLLASAGRGYCDVADCLRLWETLLGDLGHQIGSPAPSDLTRAVAGFI